MPDLTAIVVAVFSFLAGAMTMGYKAIRHLQPRPQPLGRLEALRAYTQPSRRRWPTTPPPPAKAEPARRAITR
jgi:hypothetical protein